MTERSQPLPELGSVLDGMMRSLRGLPLLTPVEELNLGRTIKLGQHASLLIDQPGLSFSDIKILDKQINAMERSIGIFIERNIGIVIKIARKYRHFGVPIEDLVQEGAIGLRRAAELYDPERGYRFSTYSYNWVRQRISQAAREQGRLTSVSDFLYDQMLFSDRQRLAAMQWAGTNQLPDQEVAEILKIDPKTLCQEQYLEPISLQTPIGEDGQDLGSTIAADDDLDIKIETSQKREAIEMAFDILIKKGLITQRERRILMLRYGLETGSPMTLEDIGAICDISRERVRQIEVKGLRCMRHSLVSSRLANLLD